MIKNPRYVYSVANIKVPVNLNFGDYMIKKFLKWDKKIAIINAVTNEKISYRQVAQDAMNLAASLTNLGLRKGDVTALCSENQNDCLSALVGSTCTGAAVASINANYSRDEFKHAMNISKPKHLICSQTAYKNHETTIKELPFVEKVIVFGHKRFNDTLLYKELLKPNSYGLTNNVRDSDFQAVDVHGQTDTLFILYSSGTTGLPKGVMLTHLNLLTACCSNFYFENGVSPEEVKPAKEPVSMSITPWCHVIGLLSTLRYMSWGWTSVYFPKFHMKLFLDTIEQFQISHMMVVPTVLVGVCSTNTHHDLSSVQQILTGGATPRTNNLVGVNKKFPNIKRAIQGYGLTETTFTVIKEKHDCNSSKAGTIGQPTMASIVKVVDLETRKPLGSHENGEICVKGPLVMKGYIGRDRREDFDEEGFFKTGDIGYYDNDGYFFVVDRLKELIKYKAYQVPPAEIEAVLLQHEAVKDAGVVGIEHKEAGEVPMGFVVLHPDKEVTAKELQDFVAERLSNPKHLRGGIKFVSEIPRNVSGKLLRRLLRNMA